MNCIIASTSTIHGSGYLEYLLPELEELYNAVDDVLFIPYARPSGISYDEYTEIARQAFQTIGKQINGIHTYDDPNEAIKESSSYFVGGGNTFLLVKTLHDHDLFSVLKEQIIIGKPYLGTSAGSNICGPNMKTTNDMPIVYPRSFDTLGIMPFNVNAHYLEPDPKSTHKGETRRTRIKEFQVLNDMKVLGLKEGSWIEAKNHSFTLKGDLDAVWFVPGQEPKIISTNSIID